MKKKVQKEYLTENERIMAAFAKVNLREAVAPTFRGRIVEDEDTYNKVQQLLDCPDMEHAHQFLLDVDFEDLDPETKQKVDDLYQLAVSQGYIENQTSEGDEEDFDSTEDVDAEEGAQPEISDMSGGFEDGNSNAEDAAVKDSIGMNAPTMNSSAYTLFYSAMKNGEIKSGECYSNANTLENAKLDAVQKLQKLGFTAVEIIAAEETDINAKGCDSAQPDEFGAPLNDGSETEETQDVPSTTPPFSDEMSDNDETSEEDTEADSEEDTEDASEEEDEDVVGEADEKSEEDDSEEEEPEEEPEEKKDLSRAEKLEFFKSYLEEFKAVLQKMKAECYAEMALADRAKFYDEMNKVWAGKPDPTEFMTDDNVDQIEHMKIKL